MMSRVMGWVKMVLNTYHWAPVLLGQKSLMSIIYIHSLPTACLTIAPKDGLEICEALTCGRQKLDMNISCVKSHNYNKNLTHVASLVSDLTMSSDYGISQVAQMVNNLPAMLETGFDPWVAKIPWRRKWQPISVFLPGKSHGWRSLVGYSPGGDKDLDTTDQKCYNHSNYEKDAKNIGSTLSLHIK